MNQGGQDPRVVPEPGRKMAEALEQAGREVWYTEIPYAGHGIGGAAPQDIIFVATSIVEFLDRNREEGRAAVLKRCRPWQTRRCSRWATLSEPGTVGDGNPTMPKMLKVAPFTEPTIGAPVGRCACCRDQ